MWPLDPDLPLAPHEDDSRAKLDVLGTARVAKNLVPTLLHHSPAHSLVVGLYGPWGHGKTSTLGFLAKALHEWEGQPDVSYARRSIIVEFNPWTYSSPEVLVASFFETLAEKLADSPWISKRVRKAAAAATRALAETAKPLLATVPTALPAGLAAGLVLRLGAHHLASGGEIALSKQKVRLGKLLRNLAESDYRTRVVVLIDDLDRADPPEVVAMLKMIRLIADLPNITYVLAADDRRVRDALAKTLGESKASSFLDKIVQVSVPLPLIPERRLRDLTEESLLHILDAAGIDSRDAFASNAIDTHASGAVDYDRHLSPVVRTLRDRARLANTLAVLLNARCRAAELHPADAILISVLSLFYPEVHRWVSRNKSALTLYDTREYEDRLQAYRAQQGISYEKILRNRLEETGRPEAELDAVLPLVTSLFPYATSPGPGDSTARLNGRLSNRIHVPERFDRYFLIDPPPEELSGADADARIQTMIKSLAEGDLEAAGQSVRALPEQIPSLRDGVLDRLDIIIDGLARSDVDEAPLKFLRFVLDWTQLALDTLSRRRLTGRLVRLVPADDAELRAQLIAALIRSHADLPDAVQSGSPYLMNVSQASELRSETARQIVAAALIERYDTHVGGLEWHDMSSADRILLFDTWQMALELLGRTYKPIHDVIDAWIDARPEGFSEFVVTVVSHESGQLQAPKSDRRFLTSDAVQRAINRLSRWYGEEQLAIRAREHLKAGRPDPNGYIADLVTFTSGGMIQ